MIEILCFRVNSLHVGVVVTDFQLLVGVNILLKFHEIKETTPRIPKC